MSVYQRKILIDNLSPGMFISRLDIPWNQSPFPIQGFYVKSKKQISELATYCKSVTIDLARSRTMVEISAEQSLSQTVRAKAASLIDGHTVDLKVKPIKAKHNTYLLATKIEKEIKEAKKLVEELNTRFKKCFDNANGVSEMDILVCNKVTANLVSSIVRNPDALQWVIRLNQHCEGAYWRSVNCVIWALVFGRHIGLSVHNLQTLASAVMLARIGMTKLPQELVNKTSPLSQWQQVRWQEYVDYSIELLNGNKEISVAVKKVISVHQERHDGSGFPRKITGDKIGLLGKIAGLVEYFESLLHPLHGQRAFTCSEACAEIYQQRGIKFQADLVEEFISAIGIYPTGSLVELTTGEVGIVLSRHSKGKLLPKVMVVLDKYKQEIKKNRVIDLFRENKKRDRFVAIKKGLVYGAYPIKMEKYIAYKGTNWLLKAL